MNCVLSGNSGLAFVMDGVRSFVVRADRPEVVEDVPVQQFHSLFSGTSDRIFLEGLALGQIKEALSFAQAASTALSLTLLVLDRGAPENLRAEAACDLQEFFEEQQTVTDVENVLCAAPLPETADAATAERLCRQAGTAAAADLLARLVARQGHIRAVCEAWDGLPTELFESADNRRASRTVCIREGLFLTLVRHKEAERDANSFLLEALRKPTMLRSFVDFRRVLQKWSGVLAETAHEEGRRLVRDIEMAESEEDYDQISVRDERPERSKTPVSRNPGAKLLVDNAIRTFIDLLPAACKTGTAAVTKLVTETRRRLEEIHTRRADERSHFVRSISNVGEQLMQYNEAAAAVELLSWSIKKGLADEFTYAALIDAWNKLGNAVRAQEVFDAAEAAAMVNEFTYAALVDAWGKSGDGVRAQEVFNAAVAAGMANQITSNALVDAWGKSGNAVRAQEVFDAALEAGTANHITYSALVDAWGKSGDALRAQGVFDDAVAAGVADAFTYAALVDAWGKSGNAARAQEVFDAALKAGMANEFTYNSLVEAWGKSGNAARAQEVFDAAMAAGMANKFTYNALVYAWVRSGDAIRAQEVFDATLAAGLADEISYGVLVDAWSKSGNPVRAQEVFDAALKAGMANEFTYNALVNAWGKSGNAVRAQEVFDAALAAGMANEVTYNALIDAWGKSGNAARAQEVFDAAQAAGMANKVTYNSLVDAWGKSGNAVRAQEVFDAALAEGEVDAATYGALVDAWGKSGNALRAQEVFDAALTAGMANEFTYSALVDAWGKSGGAVRAEEVFDAARSAKVANKFTYTALIDAWGRAGEPDRAQLVFDRALTDGHADEITDVVLLRALLSNSASEEILTRAVEFFLSRAQRDHVSSSVATTIAWAAARLLRFDWIQSLPASALDSRTLYSFALRVAPSSDALLFLQRFGSPARAGINTLRYRLADINSGFADLRSLASDCRNVLERATDLDAFSRVRITEIEARCLRTFGTIEEAIAIWTSINDLSIGNRETRASLLAESGRDLLIGGLRHHEVGQCKTGAQRLMHGWSLARLSDLHSMETLWAASEALSGYADARAEIATAPAGLVAIVRPILAEGARDGRWAMDAVRTSDFPDFYLKPALAGMEFLDELKQSSSPSINA